MVRVAYLYGKRLAAAREHLSLTQRELGEAIGGVSDETISRIERHEIAGILAKCVPRLATALKMTLEDFKAGYAAPPPEGTDAAAKLQMQLSGTAPVDGIATREGLPGGINTQRLRAARAVPEFQ